MFNLKKKKTMKKTYINPTMEIVKVATQQMLAGSPAGQVLDKNGTQIDDGDLIGGRGDDFDW